MPWCVVNSCEQDFKSSISQSAIERIYLNISLQQDFLSIFYSFWLMVSKQTSTQYKINTVIACSFISAASKNTLLTHIANNLVKNKYATYWSINHMKTRWQRPVREI